MWYDPLMIDVVWEDAGGVWNMWDDYSYYSVYDMAHILLHRYPVELVEAHYEYSIATYNDEDIRLNIKSFSKLFILWTDTVESFIERYRKQREDNRKYWESPEGRRKEAEAFKEAQKKFEEQIGL